MRERSRVAAVRKPHADAMSSTLEKKIMNLEERLRAENESRDRDRHGGEVGGPGMGLHSTSSGPVSSPALRRPRQRE